MRSGRRCGALCDTFIPSLEPPEGDEANRSFWRRAASHMAVPEGVEVALLQAGLRGGADRGPALAAGRARRQRAWPPATPQEVREADRPRRSARPSPEALAGIATLRGICGTLFYALPDLGTGRNLNWDAIGFPGPAGAAAGRPRAAAARSAAQRAPRRRSRPTSASSARAPAAGSSPASWRPPGSRSSCSRRASYHDDADFDGLELSAYQRMYLNGGPFPTAEGQVSIVAGRGRRRRHGDQLDQLPAHLRPRAGGVGLASTGSRTSPSPSYDEHLDAVFERLERERGLQRPQRAARAAARRPARSSATTSA